MKNVKKKNPRPTDPVERRIWNMERVLARRETLKKKIADEANAEISRIDAMSKDTRILLDALKRGKVA